MEEKEMQTTEQKTPLVQGEVVPPLPRRLTRSRTDRVFAGVCGGIGHYFGIDPVLVRALWVVLSLITAVVPGMILYLLAAVVIPQGTGDEPASVRRLNVQSNILWGGLLIAVGVFLLLRAFWGHFLPMVPPELAQVWVGVWTALRAMVLPAILIGVGLLLIWGMSRRNNGEKRTLVRPRDGRILAGVCAALGRYFNIDATWIRLSWIVLSVLSFGIGVVVYVVAMLAIPEEA
jgi:phage shock protein C